MKRYTVKNYDNTELIEHYLGEFVKYAEIEPMITDIKKCRDLLAGIINWSKGMNEYGLNYARIQQQIDDMDKNYEQYTI